MYRRSKFLEILLDIRQQMARDSDYDVDLFAEMIRSGRISKPSELKTLPDSALPSGRRPGTDGENESSDV